MNLLFDLDGTLIDPKLSITNCIRYALNKLNVDIPDDLDWCIGPPLKDSFAKLLASDDDKLVEEAIAIYRERFGSVGLFENKVYEDIPEALKTLQDMGHTLYVATSKPTIFAKLTSFVSSESDVKYPLTSGTMSNFWFLIVKVTDFTRA